MMLSAWMARCGINARVVDKRGTKIYSGQADGLQLRSLEIFDSFGFADRAWKEANHLIEVRAYIYLSQEKDWPVYFLITYNLAELD